MITASIVLYNTDIDLLKRVIDSYSPGTRRRLYLIDNSSNKCTSIYDDNEYIDYIYVGKNIGYGSGHNIGIKKAIKEKSKYHVVLNPDLVFESRVIDELEKYADSNEDVVYMLPSICSTNL